MAKHLNTLGKKNVFRCLNPHISPGLTELSGAESKMTSSQWRVFGFGLVISKQGF